MKYKIILLAAFFTMGLVSVQAQDSEPKNKKETRKTERKAEEERTYVVTGNLLDSMKFVLEANYLNDRRGNRAIVPNSLNFIRVDSTNAVLQIGRNTGMGSNGVGGVTAEGRISKYKVTKDEKRKSYYLAMNVFTNIGNFDVFMNVTSDGNARATISGNYGGKLTYEGDIVSLDDSRVFKGRTIF